jgi:hypothetical protein
LSLNFLSTIDATEKALETELGTAEKNVRRLRKNVRKETKDVLTESAEQKRAREHVEHLQLRITLLRNIRLNWPLLQRHFEENGLSIRLNQQAHLEHVIQFLETGKGVDEDNTAPEQDPDPSLALMTYEVQPTGAGKTGAFAIDIRLCGVPSLTLVPFDSLLDQTKHDFEKIAGIDPNTVGLVGGGEKDIGKMHTVATYAGHAALMKSNPAYRKWVKEQCQLAILDEVHYQALGETMQQSIHAMDEDEDDEAEDTALDAEDEALLQEEHDVVNNLAATTATKSLKIAVTATPKGSQKHVASRFPHCLGRVYYRQIMEEGYVVPYRIVQCDGTILEGELDGHLTQEREDEDSSP